jgi:hypothetical protein
MTTSSPAKSLSPYSPQVTYILDYLYLHTCNLFFNSVFLIFFHYYLIIIFFFIYILLSGFATDFFDSVVSGEMEIPSPPLKVKLPKGRDRPAVSVSKRALVVEEEVRNYVSQ